MLILSGLFVIQTGGQVLLLTTYVVTLIILYEMHALYFKKQSKWGYFLLSVILSTVLFFNLEALAPLNYGDLIYLRYIPLFFLALYLLELFRSSFYNPSLNWAKWLKINILVTSSLPVFYLISLLPNGSHYILFGCTVIAFCDSMALFIGKWIGKRQLSKISPNKTIEGSIGGGLSGLVAGLCIAYYFNLPLLSFGVLASILFILALLGDLHESQAKRYFGIKDSSNLLPGHGGFYDRFDSYIFSMPFLYVWLL